MTGCAIFKKPTPIPIKVITPIENVDPETEDCFEFVTPIPGEMGEPLSKEQTKQVFATLVGSELKKNACGKALIKNYKDVKNAYDPD